MTQDVGPPPALKPEPTLKPAPCARDLREARRKAALKANMARRKAQTRARGGQTGADMAEGEGNVPGPEGE